MIWISPILVPLLLVLFAARPGRGGGARGVLVALAPVPALCLALFGPSGGGAVFDSLLLGLRVGFGGVTPVFLFFTAVLWLIAGIYARGYLAGDVRRARFDGFFLLTMAGNFGLILARDVPGFYTFFALMTFSAFGLVIHSGTPEARRAARIYLIVAVVGEALLLGAIFLAAGAAQSVRMEDMAPAVAASESRDLILFMAFFGFGVKAGALPVHFWLPLAHPVAPVPGSAVLSGAMIKAGLLGWLTFLPLGQGEYPGWGLFCMVAGMIAALGAVVAGYAQEDPKTTLAYSSISQMGVMTLVIGVGLAVPGAWAAALPVLLLYALNHALAKGSLFLGAGIARSTGRSGRARWLVVAGLAVPALAIAGAPWTGGSRVKYAIKELAAGMPGSMASWLGWLLALASLGTALLLGRFVWLVWRGMRGRSSGRAHPLMWISWLVLVGGVVGGVPFATRHFALEIADPAFSAAAIATTMWPMVLGLVLLAVLGRVSGERIGGFTVPPGDLVVWLEHLAGWLRRQWNHWSRPDFLGQGLGVLGPLLRLAASERRRDLANRIENHLRSRSVPGVLFMLLVLVLAAMLFLGTPLR